MSLIEVGESSTKFASGVLVLDDLVDGEGYGDDLHG